MQLLGAAHKRKSVEKVRPEMPKKPFSRDNKSQGRTKHKNIQTPKQQLKTFKIKFPSPTHQTLSTYPSLLSAPKLAEQQRLPSQSSGQSRFMQDHYDMDSLANLLSSRLQVKANESGQSAEEVNGGKSGRKQEQSQEEYDDYVLGDNVRQDQEQPVKPKATIGKYTTDYSKPEIINKYLAYSEAEVRMELQYWNSHQKKQQQVRQDHQMCQLIQQYHQSKNKIMKQTGIKIQNNKMAVKSYHVRLQKQAKMAREISLPSIKPKIQVTIPQMPETIQYITKSVKKMPPFMGTNMRPQPTLKLRPSLSYSKLGFGVQEGRNCCEQQLMESQMESLHIIQRKLRGKNISLNPEMLRRGLLNIRSDGFVANQIPGKKLVSNPIYKVYPLG